MYTRLCAFREETEEIQLVTGLITFLLLDTCEIPKHQLLDSYIYDVLHAQAACMKCFYDDQYGQSLSLIGDLPYILAM